MTAESLATGSLSDRYAYSKEAQTTTSRSSRAGVELVLMGLASFGITVILYAAIFLPLQDTELGALFVKQGRVPYAIVWLTAWSVLTLAVKALRFHRQKRYFGVELLPRTLSEKITKGNADQFSEHIRSLSARISKHLLPRRLLTALEHFKSRGDVKEIVNLLESQANVDAGAMDSSYALIKVFIWAIPILGFIGTVVGISQAVQGFSESIGAAQELDVIQKGLGIVTQGLAKAFDTTLVALLMSMLVMFPANWLQKEEEDLLGSVDEYCSENLLRRLDDEPAKPVEPEAIKQAMAEAFDEHKSQLDVWMVRLNEVGTSLRDQVASGWADIDGRIRQLHGQNVQEIKGLFNALAEQQKSSATQLKDLQTTQIQQCSNLVTTMGQTAANVQQEIAKMQESHVRNSQHVVATLKGDLQALQQDARKTYESLAADLTAVAKQSAETLGGAADRIHSAQQAAAGSLHDVGSSVCEHMGRLAQSMDDAVKGQLNSLAETQKAAENNLSKFTLTMENVQSVHAQAMVDAAKAFRSAVRILLAQLTEKQGGHLEHLEQVSQSMAEGIHAAQRDLSEAKNTHSAAVDAAQQQLLSVSSGMERRAEEQVAHLSTAVEKIVTSLASAIEQVFRDERKRAALDTTEHLARVSKTGNDLVSSLVQSQQKLDEHIAAFMRIIDSHQELNALQGALASNLEVLSASDSFKRTLSQINTNLSHLGIVLDSVGEKAGLLWPEATGVSVREVGLGRRLWHRFRGGNDDA